MIFLRFCGLLNFLVVLSSVPAHPMMGDVETTMLPSSNEMSTTASPHEHTTDVEHVASTTKPFVEELDSQELTTATTVIDSATDMKTIAPTPPSATLSNTTPFTEGVSMVSGAQTTPAVMDNKIEEPASTTVLTTLTEPAASMHTMETNSVALPDPTSAVALEPPSEVVPDTPSEILPTSSAEVLPDPPSEIVPANALPDSPSAIATPPPAAPSDPFGLSMLSDGTGLPSMTFDFGGPNKVNEHSNGELDNVLTLSSNEETTRMASSTDSKTDGGDKPAAEPEPPKSEETKNELDSGCVTLTSSLVVLSMALLYVIV